MYFKPNAGASPTPFKCVVIRTAQGAAGERKINKYKKGKYYG